LPKTLRSAGCFDDADWMKVATGACLTSTRPAVKFAVSAIIHLFERASPCELARGNCLAKYKKKRARELKHDKFRDTTMLLADRLATRTAGRGRQVLYGLLAVLVVAAAVYGIYRWRQKRADEAEAAMGRAIAIARAEINPAPPANSKDPVFSTEQERAKRAIEEFQRVVAKYGDPYRSEAQLFIARNLLVTEPERGVAELTNLSSGSGEVAVLAKFALAQKKESDGKLDEAATMYADLARQNATIVTSDSANLRLALVYDKQGKKKEAADLLFNIVSAARSAKDKDGKSIPESAAARAAVRELLRIDPERHKQLPAPPPMDLQL
jgi:tetratricopeptide (TPR) repeat protein